MLSLIFAVALLQTAAEPVPAAPVPDPAKSSTLAATQANGLPKEDYELVAWCHGALAGQLELDPIAKGDMEKIEGKAKVEARAKADAELAAERRQYLKDYEHALAAAEAASPVAIHRNGVMAEEQGYKLWTATRNKEPIWRMLDWGMWDANDAGCGDAAKRLYDRSKLFGMALKGSDDAPNQTEESKAQEIKADEAKTEDTKTTEEAAPKGSFADRLSGKLGEPNPPAGATLIGGTTTTLPAAEAAPPPAPAAGEATEAALKADAAPAAPDTATKEAVPAPVKKKPATRTAKAKPKTKSAEAIRAELEKSAPTAAPDAAAPPAPATDKPDDASKLRGRE